MQVDSYYQMCLLQLKSSQPILIQQYLYFFHLKNRSIIEISIK
jgi:hypothetical protein